MSMDSITAEMLLDMRRTAETVMTQKAQVLEYDKKRQGNREAINALRKVAPPKSKGPTLPPAKRAAIERDSWLLIGNCFIQLPTNDLIDMLSTEQEHIEKELKETDAALKKNVEELLLMEGLHEDFSGFNLQSMNK